MLNQCNFIGRLGQDPEVRYTQSGQAVATVTLACSEKYKDKSGQQVEETEWVKIVCWGKLGEIVGQYLTKGSLAFFSGKQKTRKWEDSEGVTKYTTEIVAREMKILSSKSESSGDNGGSYGGQPSTGSDVPFGPIF